MDSTHATPTKELDSEAIGTTIHALLTTKFTLVIGEDPSALKSDKFFKEGVTFRRAQKEWIILKLE